MIEVTDKMVDAAWEAWENARDINQSVNASMIAAIEAALAAREPMDACELVRRLHGICHEDNRICDVHPEAADVIEELIEELVEALRPFSKEDEEYDVPDEGIIIDVDNIRRARALLTRMGVKL